MARCVCDIGVGGGGGGGLWKKKKHEQPLQMQQLGECLKTIFVGGGRLVGGGNFQGI